MHTCTMTQSRAGAEIIAAFFTDGLAWHVFVNLHLWEHVHNRHNSLHTIAQYCIDSIADLKSLSISSLH